MGELLRSSGARADLVLAPEAARALFLYSWPLNVRELAQTLASALVLAGSGPLELLHLPPGIRAALVDPDRWREGLATPPRLSDAEAKRRDQLTALLREHRGNVSAVARVLGRSRMQVHRWLKRYGLDSRSFH